MVQEGGAGVAADPESLVPGGAGLPADLGEGQAVPPVLGRQQLDQGHVARHGGVVQGRVAEPARNGMD